MTVSGTTAVPVVAVPEATTVVPDWRVMVASPLVASEASRLSSSALLKSRWASLARIGFSPDDVLGATVNVGGVLSTLKVVVAEAVFLALISVVVAVIPALILTAILGAGLGNLFMYAPLPYRISFLAAGIWVALVVLGAVLASDAAATRASRLTVREALSYL